MIDTNTLQHHSMRINELISDIHISILNTEKGLEFDLWTINTFRRTLDEFLEVNTKKTWFLIDPNKKIEEATQYLKKIVLQFYDLAFEKSENGIINSYTQIRPALIEGLYKNDRVLENAIILGQKTAFGLLLSVLLIVILIYFLIFFPMIREISNYNLKRTASLVFKEFKEKLPRWNKK
ncbi:MAG: hypothetical protein ACOCUT_00655 [bacterium]